MHLEEQMPSRLPHSDPLPNLLLLRSEISKEDDVGSKFCKGRVECKLLQFLKLLVG